ncbi:hypothetical protein BAUCODRAFT_32790 [Baudoinia panamericana UAMH 10762]|uniref:Uncharacterized protein n=1 Tax=Baudoinia panamericana (strain UAMH 10762) TaxID=717646 RepID=M2LRH9_BAUPA|nr:uncharacterized protein BAUCODRAFT_32790 [Baudoinia panamericana UAMH 10762]EMC97047.1 hypothetical protein BAUCODRAFT_32790 [Baudoinia panamericana UAMH 10762]
MVGRQNMRRTPSVPAPLPMLPHKSVFAAVTVLTLFFYHLALTVLTLRVDPTPREVVTLLVPGSCSNLLNLAMVLSKGFCLHWSIPTRLACKRPAECYAITVLA